MLCWVETEILAKCDVSVSGVILWFLGGGGDNKFVLKVNIYSLLATTIFSVKKPDTSGLFLLIVFHCYNNPLYQISTYLKIDS